MKKELLLFVLVFSIGCLCRAQIAAWDFTGVGGTSLPSYPATTFNANLVSASGANNITRGPTAPWSNANNSFRTTGFKNEGISVTNTDYFQITLTAVPGYSLSLSTINARFAGTASYCAAPGVSSQFAYSLDGSTFTLIGSPEITIGTPAVMNQIDLAGIASLQNVAAGITITLRYYASGQTATGGWGLYSSSAGMNGLAIGGDLSSTTTFSGTGNWNLAGNWSSGIPTSSVNAVIDGFATVDQPAQCMNLTVNPGKTLTISPTGVLTIYGTLFLSSNDSFIVKSDASGSASFIDNGISGSGTAKVERYLVPETWHYISSPVSNATATVFDGDYLKTSDPADPTGWSSWITDTSTQLQVVRGYACWKPASNPSSEAFSGFLNSGDKTITLSRNASDPWAGWHLVGNPYPSSIDLSTGISWDHFEPVAYFWNGGNYLAYPVTSGFGTHSRYVPPEQGFYLHINGSWEGNSTLTLTNAARVHNSELFLKDTLTLENALIVEVLSSVNDYSDKISVHFNPLATRGFDPGFDAYKRWGSDDAPQLFTCIGDTNVACNSLPFTGNTAVNMGFRCGLAGEFTLIAENLESFNDTINVLLQDLQLQTTQDLKINPVYVFPYDTIDDPSRFVLHFNSTTSGGTDSKTVQPLRIYSSGSTVVIRSATGKIPSGDLIIYDGTGKEVYSGKLECKLVNRITPHLSTGCYLVKVVMPDGVCSGKVFLTK